ncbi:MAG: hormogonium polysaccharide biosynthesis glycosyltransferase HpsE, partial [Spirulina sp.]
EFKITIAMIDFTVAIPTYNGAHRIPLVLERLKTQINTEAIAWEVIVIDNNSNDETSNVVFRYQKEWSDRVPLKYFFEARQGTAYARMRAVREAAGQLVGFLDDDNVPALDWVYQAVKFSKTYPKVGAYGSQVHADFEVAPPESFEKIIGFLAIRERGEFPNLYQPEILSLPTTAGLVVWKQVWQDCCPQTFRFIGRVDGSMLGGEDYEILLYIYKAGWEIWYNPDMHIYHKIPSSRLERDYLISLIHGSCLCFFPLKMTIHENWKKPAIAFKTVFGNLYNALKYKIKYWHKLQQDDIVATCELQIYLSRISSFFYYLNQVIKPKFNFFSYRAFCDNLKPSVLFL